MTSPQERKSDSPQPFPGNAESDECHETEENSEDTEDISPLEEVDFTRKSCWTDLTLEVEDEELYVPKSHLALTSRIFRVMFQSYFKEKNLDVLPLPDKTYEDVLTFLHFTHPAERLKVTYDVVPNMLPLAHEYEVQWLIDECISVMIAEMDDNTFAQFREQNRRSKSITDFLCKCCEIGILAERYSLKSVIDVFIQRFCNVCYAYYKRLPIFNEISLGVRYRILSGRLAFKDKD